MTMRRLLPDPVDDVDLPASYGYPAAGVWMRANMVSSADGAATVDGRAGSLGSPTDQQVLRLLRALSDVVIAGAGTVIAEKYGPARPRAEYQELRDAAGQPPAPVMAVVSRSLRLDFESTYFVESSPRPIVITCEAAPSDKVIAARKVADVIVAGGDDVSPALLVEALSARGHRRLLCEGGPTLLATIAADGVLDELCLTISPLLVGGPSRRILEGPPLDPPPRMRLTQLLHDDDGLIYARYEVLR
jgi:riboflavin biosynthesis pyrimidine reductase